jgi:hypothetical protein
MRLKKIYFGYKITANVHDIRDRSQIVLKIEKIKVENKNMEIKLVLFKNKD